MLRRIWATFQRWGWGKRALLVLVAPWLVLLAWMTATAKPRWLTATAVGTVGVLWIGVVLGPLADDTDSVSASGGTTSSRPAASDDAEPSTSEEQSATSTSSASLTATSTPPTPPDGASGERAGGVAVSRVVDGDTLTLADGRTVRLAQVDAPETTECFGSESTAALEALVDGEAVVLSRSTNGPERDRYGRTLADVTVAGASVNEALVRDGAAEWYEDFADEDPALAGRLQAAESEARGGERGLWAVCSPSALLPPTTVAPVTAAPPPPDPVPAAPSAPSATAGGNCDPAYPTVCIPPAPPDLDCGDVPHRRFEVRAPDPHGFDGNDNDGLGCESG